MNQFAISPVEHSPSGQVGSNDTFPDVRPFFDLALVVSRDAEGNAMSRYGDASWNLGAQSTDGTSGNNLHFFNLQGVVDGVLVARIREQHKALMWLHMDAGKMRAPETVRRASYAAAAWCSKAIARGIDLFSILGSPEHVAEELESLSQTYVRHTSALVKTLARHGSALDVGMKLPLQRLRELITAADRGRTANRQTPLIPSAVYCAILRGLVAELDDIEQELDSLLNAYRQNMAATRSIASGATKGQRKKHRGQSLAEVLQLMKASGYDPKHGASLDHFIAFRINRCQVSLMHTVAAFSGMRVGEVGILPLANVVEEFEDRGSRHYVINGYTHKLNRGVKTRTSWITSREGHRAILLAQRIAKAIFEEDGRKPSKGQEALLFCSTEHPFRKKNHRTIGVHQALLNDAICPAVTAADLDELNSLELDRPWQRAGIGVGMRWPLAFHQLRRSLSVYAHRSGMVTLPALKAQLQHVTDEMRSYYSDGYSRAVNLVFDKDHFSHEWNAAKAESSFFGYTLGLLFSDDDFLGRGAERMALTISSRNRQDTLKLFEQGKLAYRETPLGGCVSTEECVSKPLQPIPFDCLESNCVNQVVAGKRLNLVITTQEAVVARLADGESGSVEHRLEANHLRVLLKARQQLTERAA